MNNVGEYKIENYNWYLDGTLDDVKDYFRESRANVAGGFCVYFLQDINNNRSWNWEDNNFNGLNKRKITLVEFKNYLLSLNKIKEEEIKEEDFIKKFSINDIKKGLKDYDDEDIKDILKSINKMNDKSELIF